MKILLITVCVLFFSFSVLHAQYQITNYTTFNTGSGTLGANTILDIAENPVTHEMYFSSTDGLMKFDGNSFEPIISELNFPELCDIYSYYKYDIDPSGNIWFGAYDSLYCYSGTSLQSYPYFIPNDYTGILFCDSNGFIWFTEYNTDGILRFDGNNITQFTTADGLLNNNYLTCIFEDSNNNIWIGSNDGISMFDGSIWKVYTVSSGILWSDNTSTVRAICEDETGTIWISGNEIAYLTGDTWTTLNPTTLLNSSQEIFASGPITLDNNGVLWFVGSNGLFYKDDNIWDSYTEADGLPTYYIKDIYADSQNRLWVGFESKGLSVLENGIWTNYTTLDNGLADNFVFDIFEDTTNTVWFCTRHGLSNIQNNSWTSYFTDASNGAMGEIHYDYDNYLFVPTNPYFRRYINYVWEIVLINSINRYEFISNSSDDFWFAGTLGVTHVWAPFSAVTNFENYSVSDGLPNNICYCIESDSSQTIWVGTRSGIAYFDGTGFQQLIVPSDDFGNRINDIRIDLEENIWFASNYGVAKYDGTNWTFYYKSDGLADNFVNDFEIAADSSIWFATNRGVTALTDSGMISITQADGLSDCMVLTLEQDHAGNIWAGTYHGISKIHNVVDIPPNNTSEIENNNTISLFPNPATNQIQISSKELINTIEIYNMAGCLVQKMQCNSKQQISDSYLIDVSNLQAGSYFVRASGENGVWVEKVVVISF